jgi:type VII secretion protein EccE
LLLTEAVGLGPGPDQVLAEDWGQVRCGQRFQTSFAIRSWPQSLNPLADLLSALDQVPAVSTTLAVELTAPAANEEHLGLLGLLRVCGYSAGNCETAAQVLQNLAEDRGFALRRLDGQQGPALAASLPFGRGL